jgi:hypothetical protein
MLMVNAKQDKEPELTMEKAMQEEFVRIDREYPKPMQVFATEDDSILSDDLMIASNLKSITHAV